MQQSFETSGRTGIAVQDRGKAGLSYFLMQSPGKCPTLRGSICGKILAKSLWHQGLSHLDKLFNLSLESSMVTNDQPL